MESHAHRRSTDANPRRQIPLGRQSIAGPQHFPFDEGPHERDDLFGAAFNDGIASPSSSLRNGHKWTIQSYTPADRQKVTRSAICRSRGLFRSVVMKPNVELRGLTSGAQSTV